MEKLHMLFAGVISLFVSLFGGVTVKERAIVPIVVTTEVLATTSAEVTSLATTKVDLKMEVINGISVPPEPDKKLNSSTLAGVDINGNSVRDDVERGIAREALTKIDFENALVIAKNYQSILTTEGITQKFIDKYMVSLACAARNTQKNLETRDIQKIVYNTPERIKKFKGITYNFSGGVFDGSDEECKILPSGEHDMTYFINQNSRKY